MLALNLLEEAERQVASLRRENQQFKSLQKEHKQLVGLGVLPACVLCRAWRALQNELFNAGCGVGTKRMDPPKFFPHSLQLSAMQCRCGSGHLPCEAIPFIRLWDTLKRPFAGLSLKKFRAVPLIAQRRLRTRCEQHALLSSRGHTQVRLLRRPCGY